MSFDRKILKANRYETGCGTHKYLCEWQGEWEHIDLITALYNGKWDNPTPEDLRVCHFGGRVEHVYKNDNGNYEGKICVYYD